MAKGNLFLGTAGNSVGDVVMYRREGSQVSRVRVRKVKNPKTDAQSLQRAAFSPVAKFYSPLAVVLERSFEGLSKSKSYAKFLKTNVDLARANGWLLPKGTGFFPLPYKLTNGTLPAFTYQIGRGLEVGIPGLAAGATTIGQLSTALTAYGYKDGDVITFVVVTTDSLEYANANYVPHALQFIVDTTSATTFEEEFGINVNFSAIENSIIIRMINDQEVIAGATIVARFENDKWRRSTQTLAVTTSITDMVASANFRAAAIASYGPNAGDPNPLVYLDGDTLEG